MTFNETEKKELLNHIVEGLVIATKEKVQDVLNNESYVADYAAKISKVAVLITDNVINSVANES